MPLRKMSEQSIMKSINIAFQSHAESGTNMSQEPEQNEFSNEFDPYTDASLSGTPLQSPENASEKDHPEQSIMKSINIAFQSHAESGTNMSQEPEQNKFSNEFDPYTDASLSGTLEWIHVDENILCNAAKDISHELEYQIDSLIDHNYSNPSGSSTTNSVTMPPLTQLNNDSDEHPEVDCNHLYTELSQDTVNYSAHNDVDDIETEIVSMECTETYITSAKGSFSHIQ